MIVGSRVVCGRGRPLRRTMPMTAEKMGRLKELRGSLNGLACVCGVPEVRGQPTVGNLTKLRGKLQQKLPELLGVNVLEQIGDSPDTQPFDFTWWVEVEIGMVDHEDKWENEHPGELFDETLPQFEARLKRTAKRVLTKKKIDKGMESMHRRVRELKKTKGERMKND